MPTSTIENYLKALYALQQAGGQTLVPLGKLAERLSLTPGTVTAMVKRLSDRGLIQYEARGGARLTAQGERLALQVLRRHRLIELFLVQALGFDWSEVHEEAEELEHAASDKLLDRIDHMLGYPQSDPHGDPIPSASGRLRSRRLVSLAEMTPGPATVARIRDHDPGFLKFVHQRGLTPGAAVRVSGRDEAADVVELALGGGEPFRIGLTAAAKISVTPAPRSAAPESPPGPTEMEHDPRQTG